MEQLITIAEVEGHQASYIASLLESHGLTVFIENENTSSMLPHLAIPAKLRVPKDQAAKALDILQMTPGESMGPETED